MPFHKAHIDKIALFALIFRLINNYMSNKKLSHKKFEESYYSEKLKTQIRFAPFKPAHISNEKWVKTLGADVHNLNHMKIMRGLCKSFAKYFEDLSTEDIELLAETAEVHDWAESIIGDIPAPEKTLVDKKNEQKILRYLFKKYKLPNKERILSILFNENDSLFHIFELFEKIGYFRTALIAWEKSKTEKDEILKENLKDLTTSVVSKQYPNFFSLSKDSKIINTLFQARKAEIEEIISHIRLKFLRVLLNKHI